MELDTLKKWYFFMLLNFQRCRAERRDIKNCFYLKKDA